MSLMRYNKIMRIKELGHVVLYVSSLKRSADFYKNILGFKEIHREASIAVFSSGHTHHELMLIEVGGAPRSNNQAGPGLYHIGFKIGDTPEDIKKAYAELKKEGIAIHGVGDHGVTHSIYIHDPDGNELELYADVSDEWKQNPLAVLKPVQALDLD